MWLATPFTKSCTKVDPFCSSKYRDCATLLNIIYKITSKNCSPTDKWIADGTEGSDTSKNCVRDFEIN